LRALNLSSADVDVDVDVDVDRIVLPANAEYVAGISLRFVVCPKYNVIAANWVVGDASSLGSPPTAYLAAN